MSVDISKISIPEQSTLREAMACINADSKGIALVLDSEGRLVNTVTDGDIRRVILEGMDLEQSVSVLYEQKEGGPKAEPITAPLDSPKAQLLELMQNHWIFQVPLLDESGRVAGLAVIHELLHGGGQLDAVIMAGGQGMRLRPLTENTPKPLLPVGDKPIMERIVNNLHRAGIKRVSVTSHYRADQIAEHFGDGSDFGVDMEYFYEDNPLGTAGGLSLIQDSASPFLVINGDILTNLDFRAMLNFHRFNRADLTMAVRTYEFEIPFGVVECDGPLLKGVREKPRHTSLVNAGIYLLEPSVMESIPEGERLDMPDLINVLLKQGSTVATFPLHEYWRDIGHHDDYRQAQEDVENGSLCS